MPTPTQPGEEGAGADEEAADGEDVDMSGRATRSKTAPQRKEATPLIAASSEVITLSDVQAARDVLADKANQHWVKGLGGGQNKESETIVNFLYKLKVGPGTSPICITDCRAVQFSKPVAVQLIPRSAAQGVQPNPCSLYLSSLVSVCPV